MSICDAIAQAVSEHHVYFLVAAYVEHQEPASMHGVPPVKLMSLPICGLDDLRRRRDVAAALIRIFFSENPSVCGMIRECHDVFTAAIDRLAALEQAATPVAA